MRELINSQFWQAKGTTAPKIVLHQNYNPALVCEHHLGYKVSLHLFGIILPMVGEIILVAEETK